MRRISIHRLRLCVSWRTLVRSAVNLAFLQDTSLRRGKIGSPSNSTRSNAFTFAVPEKLGGIAILWHLATRLFMRSSMPASLLHIPRELLEEIVLCATQHSSLGPPREWHALILTSRTLHHLLSLSSSSGLHGRIFSQKFDFAAPVRRLGGHRFLPANLKAELRRRFDVLRYARDGSRSDDFCLLDVFTTAYLMLLEDEGKNMAQLLWAGIPALVDMFLQHRIFNGSTHNNGWLLGSEINSLAVTLSWLFSSHDSVKSEGTELHSRHPDFLGFCALAAFRYPCHNALECQYYPPDLGIGEVAHRDPCSPPHLRSREIAYFGRTLKFQPPALAPFAILSHFAKLETVPLSVPDIVPRNRHMANALGWQGPTQEDIEQANKECRTRFVDFYKPDPLTRSQMHDSDWLRATNLTFEEGAPHLALYRPGMLAGNWQGFSVAPCLDGYRNLMSESAMPSQLPMCSRRPLYLTLREHYCYSPSLPIPLDSDSSYLNAWLPPSCRWIDQRNGISIYNDKRSFVAFYETFSPESDTTADPTGPDHISSRFAGAIDVVITGETDEQHGEAWGRYRAIGRIRPCDGLLVLLVEPYDPQQLRLGRWIYRGYLISSQNWVGRWRAADNSATGAADWEALFSLCKDSSG